MKQAKKGQNLDSLNNKVTILKKKLIYFYQIVENAIKFNGILGKTEKYWEGKNKEKKKTLQLENDSKEGRKDRIKNVSNINSTSYISHSDFFNDDSLKDSLILNEETKLNNFIKIIENKLGEKIF